MHLRFALISAVLCAASYGCATPADESAAKAPEADTQAAKPLHREASTRTGSRLPPLDSGDGSGSTSASSRDDYQDAARRVISPTSGR